MKKYIGLTTTVPIEVLFAAGDIPVDINNIFINDQDASKRVEEAELAGYPRNVCGWIKGLYATVLQKEKIKKVIAVTQGDCSNTHALMETWQLKGIEIIPFDFPYNRDPDLLKMQIDKLITHFNTTWKKVLETKNELDKIRSLVHEIDRLTWETNQVSGFHNHLYQVSCSDFNHNPQTFKTQAQSFIEKAKAQQPYPNDEIRLGFIGVPPIISNLYEYLEKKDARVIFNEVQRQFSMPNKTDDIIEQYRLYTYPYDVFARIEDIQQEIKRRNIHGIIHYAQSFCFRQIEDLIFRQKLNVPILTLEGDKPGPLDARSTMRIDSFLEMLR